MDARGAVAQSSQRDTGWMQEGRLLNWARGMRDDGWMQEGRLLNWARGMRMMDGCKRDMDDGWIQEGWLLNWARGMQMTDGCKRYSCSIGQEGCR